MTANYKIESELASRPGRSIETTVKLLEDLVDARVEWRSAELKSRVVRLEWLVIACLILSLISLGVAGVLVKVLLFP